MIEIPTGTRVYGIQLPIQAQSNTYVAEWERTAGAPGLARVAQAADDAGFFYVGVCDHIAIPDELIPAMGTYWSDCIATLAWLAPQTTRVNLLSHVYILPYRHPAIAAKAFSTLDHLSGGRAICGIGAGHVVREFELLGADYEHRGRDVAAKVPQLIAALEGEAFADGFGASPRPAQSPRPPVWIAGSSPAAIRRAGRLADGWLPQGPSSDAMVQLLETTREQAGRADLPMAIGHITPFLSVGTPGWDVGTATITGSPQEVADKILAGTPARANQIQVRFKSRTLDEQCDQMAAFGAEVAPLIEKV
jgi:alkanesulfonate monooxygenase SsuD/methylene tetrahydromethanopterin reductase-like flavin-dependent oxidoreductase (luciferase family)